MEDSSVLRGKIITAARNITLAVRIVCENESGTLPRVRLRQSLIPGLIESGRTAAVHDEAVAFRRDKLRESDYCQFWDAGLAELVPPKDMPNFGWPPPLFPNEIP